MVPRDPLQSEILRHRRKALKQRRARHERKSGGKPFITTEGEGTPKRRFGHLSDFTTTDDSDTDWDDLDREGDERHEVGITQTALDFNIF